MKYIYIVVILSLLGVIILLSNKSSTVEYKTVTTSVVKTDSEIIAERVNEIMASDSFIEEMKHVAIARAMLELSGEYLEQAETLQLAGNENMQKSLTISQNYYDGNF